MSVDIGIDLGTASVLVYVKGKGVILKEPSVVAFDRDTNAIKAIGEEARLMLGRTPGNIVAIRPLRQGVISDYTVTEKMIKYFVQKAMGKRTFKKPRISICVPSGVTEVEKKAVEEATYAAGAREVNLIEEPVAAAIGAGIDISKPCGNMIVDVGGGTSDIAVISLGGTVVNTSIKLAGDDFDEAIIGMKVGETKTFGFEGPDIVPDDDGNVKMDSYETTVTVKRIIRSVAPEPDDAWARSTKPGIESLEQLRAEVEEKIRSQHEDDFQRSAQMLAGNELAKRIVGDIPDLIYGVAMKEARENLNWKLQSENQTLDEFLAAQGMTQEELSNALMLQVRTQLNRQFAMNAYAKHKGLVVEEDDLSAFFESIAPGNANIAHADFNRDGRIYAARCAALRLKAAKRAVEEADITRIGAAS